MNFKNNLIPASGYDDYVRARAWTGPGILYEKLHRYFGKGDTLLDLGIGTGLCSEPFFRKGMQIYGIDGAEEMLNYCEGKQFARDLVLFDLTSDRAFPFPGLKFNLILAHAVFHFMKDLDVLFTMLVDRLVPGGIFAFTVIDKEKSLEEFVSTDSDGVYKREQRGSEIEVFAHSPEYINRLCTKLGFEILENIYFTGFKDIQEQRVVNFILSIVRKS